MYKNLTILAVCAGVLGACGGGSSYNGLTALGSDFARAFAQDRNAEPIDLTNVSLDLKPTLDPFNP